MNAHVKNGRIELDEPVDLPEGVALVVHLATDIESPEEGTALLERMRGIVGIVNDLPEDMALNHDHYLHGAPRK